MVDRRSTILPWATGIWGAFLALWLVTLALLPHEPATLQDTLIQWDGGHYNTIATSGYYREPSDAHASGWEGNVGWFPLYPLISRAFAWSTGLSIRWSLLAVSWLCGWAAIVALLHLLVPRFGSRTAVLAAVALLGFPTAFYFATAFPYSLYLLLALLVFHGLERKRYAGIVLPAACLTACYPSGVVIWLPIGLELWRERDRRARAWLAAALVASVLALLAIGCWHWWLFDDFFAFVRFQARGYGHEPTFPLWPIAKALLADPPPHLLPQKVGVAFTVLLVCLCYHREVPAGWQLYMFGVLLFTPSMGTVDSYQRHVIVAWPLALMVALSVSASVSAGGWRRWLSVVYLVVALGLWRFVYMPAYALGRLV